MAEDLTLAEISTDVISSINTNFSQVEDAVNAKAEKNGDTTQVFNVATATESTQAINKEQFDSLASTLNSSISEFETEINAKFATLDTSNMPNLANNITNPNTQIDFSAGFCFDDTLTFKIASSAMTKKLDANFVEGNGNGGLDTGSKAANTWYHCFAIVKNDNTSDFLFSTSVSNPTMPTDYIYKRRIGSIKTDNSGNILKFVQIHDTFLWDNMIQDLYITSGFSTSYQNLTVSVPLGIVTEGLFSIETYTNSYGGGFFLSPKLCTNITLATECKGDNTEYSAGSVLVDTSSQIKYKSSSVYFNYVYVYCNGWKDFRGIK